MKPILPCLAFANAEQTEQAVRTYVEVFRTVFGHAKELARSTFSQAEIDTVQCLHGLPPDQLPGPAGAVKTIRFQLNGGGYFGQFHESFSLYVNWATQAQIDRLHEALSDGGRCSPAAGSTTASAYPGSSSRTSCWPSTRDLTVPPPSE